MTYRLTRGEFRRWAEGQTQRYERIAGEPIAMSPSTQSIDSSDKLADYFRVPSIQHYLIVRAKRREIIHHARSGGTIVSRPINIGAIRMAPPGITIDVTEVYAGTE